MKIKKIISSKYKFLAVFLLIVVTMAFTLLEGGDKRTTKVELVAGDAYRMFINNLDIPMNREGVMGDVLIDGRDGGRIDNVVFLFSGGFFMSGITNGRMWANAVASASRIQDYVPGTYEFGRNDSRAQLYVVAQRDGDFSQSWMEWKDAVALGAEFYDGDGDGIYNPVDRNSNGKWDSDEDRPDLIGDETVWCVYHDAVSPALRAFNDIDPQGIEIRQTVFAFASKGVTGNMIFVRYNIQNTGLLADVIDSVYFSVWADPDLGDAYDDLVGCDVSLNAGFLYNDGDDAAFGANPPCFMIDFFQGPVAYIPNVTFTDANGNGLFDDGDTPLDTATNVRGITRGIEEIPGAKNLGLSSFTHYIQSDPTIGDPNTSVEVRNYITGLARQGEELDPCDWYLSDFYGAGCETTNNKFWYSGDPVTSTGWINNTPVDQRQMSNTGPFQLIKGQPINIIAAYVVGRGTNALNGITVAREYDEIAQLLFDSNFPSPPPPPPIVYNIRTGEDFIDIGFQTSPNILYNAIDTVLDVNKRVQGFYINAYRTNTKAGSVQGIDNVATLAYYDLNDSIDAIYRVAGNGGEDLIIPNPPNKLDSAVLADPETGRIVLKLRQDPLTGGPFIKGKVYYFTITQYALNHNIIVNRATDTYGPAGDYLDATGSGLEEVETAIIPVFFGKDLYDPATDNGTGIQVDGAANGNVSYLVVNRDQLTGQEYSVEFFTDKSAPATVLYTPYWRLRNNNTNTVLIDSSKVYDFDTTNYAGNVTEGFLVKVKSVTPVIGESEYETTDTIWYRRFLPDESTGIYYVGKDVAEGSAVTVFGSAQSNVIRADKLRKVEIRFGDEGKAYRYLNGFIGTTFLRTNNQYIFASGVTPADTIGKGSPGKWDLVNDRPFGFVDVPFTAWVVDEKYNEERQLAVGFIERRGVGTGFFGNPDGNWDPGDTLKVTREVIMVFDAPYDPNGGQIEYTGGAFTTTTGTVTVWSDPNKGYTVPVDAQGITEEQRLIAASPWFNSMYVIALEKNWNELILESRFYTPGDKLIIPMSSYPYTDLDKYTFTTVRSDLTSDQKRALFDKVNVYPNPLYAHNPATSFTGSNPDEPWVTFSNLPEEVNIKIYTLSGILIRTLATEDKATPTLPFLNWNLQNEDGLRVASGMYLAIVSAPGYGEKVLKFAIIMPQKQIQRF